MPVTERPIYRPITLIRYCPQGEVAYLDRDRAEKTFPNRPEMWGRQVSVHEILKYQPLSKEEI